MQHKSHIVATAFFATSLTMFSACGNDNSANADVEASTKDPTATGENTNNTFIDSRDGKTYKTVKIGKQTWMAENLNYEIENSFCYDDDITNCDKYGRLYTWPVAMDLTENTHIDGICDKECVWKTPSSKVRGICPEGWHIPSREDWSILVNKVGNTRNAGSKLRSTSGWVDKGSGNGTDNYEPIIHALTSEVDKGSGNGTDNYGFTALPAGGKYLEEIGFSDLGTSTHFWSTTYEISPIFGDTSVYALDISSYNNEAPLDILFSSSIGCSLRCLKD